MIRNYFYKWPHTERSIITDQDSNSAVILEVYNYDVDDTVKSGDGYIWSLFVNASFRGQGIGRMLLKKAEDIARDSGCKKVFLDWSHEESEQWVLEWYERNGYEEVAFGPERTLLRKYL